MAAAWRSHGIGRALVIARERIASQKGCERLYVSVDPVDNFRWFDFFKRRGYTALQGEPYRKREPRHSENGRIEEVLIWRQDLVLDIQGPNRETS